MGTKEQDEPNLLNRFDLAQRWKCSTRKIDKLRAHGKLPWIDLTCGQGKRPIVRFRKQDIAQFEVKYLQKINIY